MIKYEIICTRKLCHVRGPWYARNRPIADTIRDVHETHNPKHWEFVTIKEVEIAEEIKA